MCTDDEQQERDASLMRDFLRQEGLLDSENPALAEAADLIYQAYDTDDSDRRLELARDALAICPDCADAYVCVAEMIPSAAEAIQWYRWAVEAGERLLAGPEGMSRYQGHFWASLETRPYMRARLGLAQCLWSLGNRDEAIEHCLALLDLNPEDNQGVRYVLCSYYCDIGLDDRLEQLLDAFEDDGATDWLFSRALLAFRREGDTESSRRLLCKAHEANTHVIGYMLGGHTLPPSPGYVVRGEETEAASYVNAYMSAWRSTPGSVTWVRKTLRIALPEEPEATEADWSFLVGSVQQLPQKTGEIWQVDVRRVKVGKHRTSDMSPVWTLAIVDPGESEIISVTPCREGSKPSPHEILTDVLEAMRNPGDGQPRRPDTIQVRLKTYVKSWSSDLEEIDVQCDQIEDSGFIDQVFGMMKDLGQAQKVREDQLAIGIEELAALPLDSELVWQTGIRKLAVWVSEDGDPRRPWSALVVDCSNDLIVGQDLTLDDVDGGFLWKTLAYAMLAPPMGEPRLPGTIEVADEEARAQLLPYLEPLEIECIVCEKLEELDFIFGELAQSLGESGQVAMVDTPGVTTKHVGGLFVAAADYYRKQPWRHVPGDRPIRVQCDQFQTSTWYAVVMGQSGMALGLAMYEDLEVLKALLRDDEDSDRRNSALTLMYGEAFEIPIRDLDAAEQRGWPIAGPEAYPLALRVNPGMAVRPPLAWEVELLEACLQAIPPFLKREDPTPARMNMPISTGELVVELSWLE